MRWRRGGRSRNLEDRRAQRPRRAPSPFPLRLPGRVGRGGPARLPAGGRRLSLGGLVLLVVIFFLLRSQSGLLDGGAGFPAGETTQLPFPSAPGDARTPPVSQAPPGSDAREEELVDFVSFVLDDIQETWARQLPGYRDAKLVLFRDVVQSACGFAQSASGPFYCPQDQKVYVDLGFYEEMRRRFGAPGDFAQAYVIAHEIGHHVQRLSGIEPEVRRAQRSNPRAANELSVRMELQADCLAGVWGHAAARRGLLEPGDVEEGLNAAAAIGDDRMQRMSTGRVVPEAFTHGSSAQRVRWFRQGLESGDPDTCDTFGDVR